MSRPVATLEAIMQKASCGVRILIACQLRFSTSTIDLFNMSFIVALEQWGNGVMQKPILHYSITPCLFPVFVFIEMRLAAAVGNAPTLPVSEIGVPTFTLSGKIGSPCW